MPSLHRVCVFEDLFTIPIDTTGSPNVLFATDCGANIISIPDTIFNYKLINEGVDTNGDSLISYSEAELIRYLNVSAPIEEEGRISDFTGIEAFVNLDTLNCSYNELTSLDLSSNTALSSLNCRYNQLSSLNLSLNSALLLHPWPMAFM